MFKINLSLKTISLYFCFLAISLSAFSQTNNDYNRLVDSADIHIDYNSEKALTFLEAIPKPIEENIPGRVAEYYSLKAIIHDEFNEYTKYHQCAILSIKYAEKENNFCVAGEACIGLFSNLYFIEKKPLALKYLEKAREYYKKCDYEYGAIDVEQVEAYAMFLDGDFKACNNFLLPKLKNYIDINEDPYYQMFALYMLTSNYIYLDDFKNAHKYFNVFKTLEENPTVIKFNYYSFEGAINCCFADVFFKQKQIDSTNYYLKKSSKSTSYLAEDALNDYYRLNADLNKHIGNINRSKIYIDSILSLQSQIHENTIEASFEVNDSLLKAESELIVQNEKKTSYKILVGSLVIALLLLSLLYFVYYRKQKSELDVYSHETNNSLSYLKSNNEQLAVKVHGLEEYIKNLKIEVKQISRTESIELQKERIKDLYKSLHINSSTLLDKSENHLDLVNELNIDFFKKIEKNYPQLNKSEIIICYYLFMGFSNKEIAVFLNTTIRSVESRRYRISKKINIIKTETTLLEYLQSNFSDTLNNNFI